MKTQNVFAYEMERRPESFKANRAVLLLVSKSDGGDVIGYRIEPYVHRVIGIVRHWNPPTHGRSQTADGKILQAAAHETLDFIAPRLGLDKIRPRFIQLKQCLIVIRQPKEVALFRDSIQFSFMDQTCRWIAGIGGLCVLVFSLVSRAGRTEPAFIMSFV